MEAQQTVGGIRVKIQKMGGVLSGMVMPNIGAFISWGLITALFLNTGWIPNETFAQLIDPIKVYLLPVLIGFMGGYNIYSVRGGVIASVVTMGAVVGADIPMFMGAMVVGPIAAILLKRLDKVFDGHIKPGLEMLVNNFSSGILGLLLTLLAFIIVGPFFQAVTAVLTDGVNVIIQHGWIPITSIFIEPAKILFLNNAINHGILGPIGLAEAADAGKSILFLLEPNPGPGLGVLLAYSFFGKGMAKASAPGVAVIHAIGGIHEPYFPFILMKPVMILAAIGGAVVGSTIFSIFDCGLVATASPGSFFSILAVAPKGDYIPILAGILASTAVSLVIGSAILKLSKQRDDELTYEDAVEKKDDIKAKGKDSLNTQVAGYERIQRIIFACDAGMGSSAMGASILKNKLKKAGFTIDVSNAAINNLTDDPNVLIVTQESLLDRATQKTPSSIHETVDNFLNSPKYDEIVEKFSALKKE
ncbi:MAG: PTS mannitol transporter subunit IICB [Enterococcus avium]|jgi:PTS system mannitol-specific IIC component